VSAVLPGLVHPRRELLESDDRPLDLDVDLAQERLAHGACGDRDRGLARAGALERVPNVVEAVLERAREVGVPGARERHRLRALPLRVAFGRPGAHPPGPVLVVAVADDERERRAERAPVPETGEHLDHVGFELLPRTTPVSLLAPVEVAVDRRPVEHEPGREPGEDRHERGTVRLARRCQRQRHGSSVLRK
jgi:hypothetical protein